MSNAIRHRVAVVLILLLALAGWLAGSRAPESAFAQNPTPVQSNVATQQLTLMPQNPVAPVTTVEFQPSIGGTSTLLYWFVSHDASGNVGAPVGPFLATNTATPSAAYPNKITLTFPPGVVSVDVLRLASGGPPSGACGCAVATGVAIGSFSDNVASTSAYTVAMTPSQVPVVLLNSSTPTVGGSFTPGDLLTVQSVNPLVLHDGGAVPGAIDFPVGGFTSQALTQVGPDAGFFTFPQARTLVQWGIQLLTAPAGCTTNAQVIIMDSTASKELGRLTLSNGNATYLAAGSIENSGAVPAGDSLQLGEVATAAAGCTTSPAGEQFLGWFR